MPRQKSIVMETLDPQSLREYAHRRAVEDQQPYLVFSPKQMGEPKSSGWSVIHQDRTRRRIAVMSGLDRQTAKDFKELLETAWVQGRISAMLD